MPDVNPYAPPRTDAITATRERRSDVDGYVPLGRRTTVATIALGLDVGVSLLLHLTGAGPEAATWEGLASLASAVCVLMWIYRAAKNLPGLGRYGMEHSPGWCVGSFFIPIASLWYPFQGMQEIWKASDPAFPQGSWPAAEGTPLLGTWWGAYLMASVGATFAAGLAAVSAGKNAPTMLVLGLGVDAIRGVAAVALVALMQQITARQVTIAEGVTSAA